MNAELFARSPDNVRLLLAMLEDEPVGSEDFYCRWVGNAAYKLPPNWEGVGYCTPLLQAPGSVPARQALLQAACRRACAGGR